MISFFVVGVRFPFIPPGLEKLLTPLDPGDRVVSAEKFSRFSIFLISELFRDNDVSINYVDYLTKFIILVEVMYNLYWLFEPNDLP